MNRHLICLLHLHLDLPRICLPGSFIIVPLRVALRSCFNFFYFLFGWVGACSVLMFVSLSCSLPPYVIILLHLLHCFWGVSIGFSFTCFLCGLLLVLLLLHLHLPSLPFLLLPFSLSCPLLPQVFSSVCFFFLGGGVFTLSSSYLSSSSTYSSYSSASWVVVFFFFFFIFCFLGGCCFFFWCCSPSSSPCSFLTMRVLLANLLCFFMFFLLCSPCWTYPWWQSCHSTIIHSSLSLYHLLVFFLLFFLFFFFLFENRRKTGFRDCLSWKPPKG